MSRPVVCDICGDVVLRSDDELGQWYYHVERKGCSLTALSGDLEPEYDICIDCLTEVLTMCGGDR